ncbi:hypothetical protein GCM10023091_36050 [Ravibacter arvi]|uniref:YdhG-like domain-containing protein n=1 Tax=Ravibacter arvi TaxID=2051041 RepID=A0ABP8M8Z7_9BACT
MAKNKTEETERSVEDFILAVEDERQRDDSFALARLMEEVSGHPPRMWGPTIIGFGRYHYRYASGHEGDAPLLGFSPRKAAISVYAFTGLPEHEHLLEGLGRFKMGKACIYVKKMSDIDAGRLTRLCRQTIAFLQETYGDRQKE